MKHTTFPILISLLLAYIVPANAQEVSRAEFDALLKRVQLLEQQLKQTEEQKIETIVNEVAQRSAIQADTPDNNTSIIDKVVNAVQFRQEAAVYPWMDAEKWSRIKKGMSSEAVIRILGKPYTDEPSLRKRIDNVFTYSGRRVSTNKRVEGKIKFYKDAVVDIETPNL